MDSSHTATTIGRSQRGGLDSMRALLAQLHEEEGERPGEINPSASSRNSSSDTDDDIDSETAINTVYNLLSELGDLNRSNRRAAEVLAEKFSELQDTTTATTEKQVERIVADKEVQTDGLLDTDVLVAAVHDHQDMAREYEATLARALQALRAAAFDRHTEIADVQTRYRELLADERSLTQRLQAENAELRAALSSAATAMRGALDE
ncbi:hypothetical protein GGI04_001484 [Coemansia thaxteri]|uniref:Uncharacterized protein n=1 Tax=Coemansia thaxteri TaxID=2663907 RepID=A0A9W8BGE6_9FUNG|nr:hypothetical protein H4R26_002501 [Coemansia thaxteri]KAJ2007539.1 hypothetical protein GGI04_001484 [Coemansia thaxteri]KAJ2472470.1 hypothetical protein GGI02_001556 [Coemansia sp. RSA 2322]